MKPRFLSILLLLILAGCAAPIATQIPTVVPTIAAVSLSQPAGTGTPAPASRDTPVLTLPPSAVSRSIRIDDSVPATLRLQIHLPSTIREAAPGETASATFRALPAGIDSPVHSTWVFALVAPFPTVLDEASLEDIRAAWAGMPPQIFAKKPLLLSAATKAAFEALWGPASAQGVQVVAADRLLDTAWAALPAWAIVPFEELGPRWKVLRVEGLSPLDKTLDVSRYPLAVSFGLNGDPAAVRALASGPDWLPASNRDPYQMTVLVMTGVTALVRKTAEMMDEKGPTYPGEKIRVWLRDADLTHISNEVPFLKDCPAPAHRDPRFCSAPAYLELLKDIHANVIELTGNHELDWGPETFLKTLATYDQQGWAVYGGGENLEAARQAVTVEANGNKFAFIGCNPAGPQADWATTKTPGTAACDFNWMKTEIARLRQEGYLVIATLQHVEVCSFEPHLTQKADFGKLAAAGAVIVSGSQAHCPQAMTFTGDQFIHYGLGNLFFDQMDAAARREFVDRHVFYAGRYISTELLTANLENYAQPVPMNSKDRSKLLEDAFRASGWIK